MTVLITGAAGFIGSYTARALLRRGDRVVGLDNFHAYYDRRAKERHVADVREVSQSSKFAFYEGDIRDRNRLETIFQNEAPDKIIHLAAMAGVPYSLEDPGLYMDVNINGTTNVADCAVSYGIENVVFASSSSVYGSRTTVPFRETEDVDAPVSPYAASKRMGEILMYTYHYLYGLPVSCLRFFTVYGPFQRPYGMVIQRFMKQMEAGDPVTIYGDGTMGRDFTYIDDIVNGILAALDADYAYEIFNLGNSYPVTVLEVVEALEEAMGISADRTFLEKPSTEVPVTYADISKAQECLGYNPHTPFNEGVKRQYEVFKDMPEWYKELKA